MLHSPSFRVSAKQINGPTKDYTLKLFLGPLLKPLHDKFLLAIQYLPATMSVNDKNKQ